MIAMRLLEGDDYLRTYAGDYAGCLGFCPDGCSESAQLRKTERGEFFHKLWQEQKGGILVAENEAGEVVGWFSFLDKAMARKIFWPCRRENDDMQRLVGVCLLVDYEKRGLGIGTTLAEELVELAKEWGYRGVEVACREVDPRDPGLTWHTPAPFREAGFVEVERYHCELIYPADFIVMEYVW